MTGLAALVNCRGVGQRIKWSVCSLESSQPQHLKLLLFPPSFLLFGQLASYRFINLDLVFYDFPPHWWRLGWITSMGNSSGTSSPDLTWTARSTIAHPLVHPPRIAIPPRLHVETGKSCKAHASLLKRLLNLLKGEHSVYMTGSAHLTRSTKTTS